MDDNAKMAFMLALQGNPQMQEAVAAFANRPDPRAVLEQQLQPTPEMMQQAMDTAGAGIGSIGKVANSAGSTAAKALQALPAARPFGGTAVVEPAAKGFGKVIQMADGGVVPPALAPSSGAVDFSSTVPQMNPSGMPISMGGPISPIMTPNLMGMGYSPDQGIPMGMAQPQMSGPGMFAVEDIPGMQQDPDAGPATAPQMPGQAPQGQSPGNGYESILNREAQVQQDYFKEQEKIRAQQAEQSRLQLESFMQKNKELSDEREFFMQDLKNTQIDPSRYMHSMDAGAKISTAIGLLIGGLSTAAENPAVKFLDKQIDRDIEAQKADLGKKQNLLSANLQQFGNLRDAEAMTRIMHNDYMTHLLEQAAAKAGSPMAKLAAEKQAFDYKQKSAALQSQIAMSGPPPVDDAAFAQRQQMLQATGKRDQAKEEMATRVPGMGNVNMPEDAKILKEMVATKKVAGQAIDDLLKISNTPFKSMRPEQISNAKVLQTTLVAKLKTFLAGTGTMSDQDRQIITEAVADPTAFFSLDSMNRAKLNTLKQALERGVSAEAETRGIQGQRQTQSAPVRSFKPSK